MKIIDNRSSIDIDAYTKHIDEKKHIDIQQKINTKGIIGREDTVELSSIANKITEVKKLIDAVPDIREQKIADIKTQIVNGTYQLNGNRIASRMLQESLLNDLP